MNVRHIELDVGLGGLNDTRGEQTIRALTELTLCRPAGREVHSPTRVQLAERREVENSLQHPAVHPGEMVPGRGDDYQSSPRYL